MSIDTSPEAAAPDAAAATLDQQAVERFVMKVATDLGIGHNGVLAYLGDRLGLWRALADATACTSEELAERCGLAERYVREWLAAQAAAGYVHYDPTSGRFTSSGSSARSCAATWCRSGCLPCRISSIACGRASASSTSAAASARPPS